MSSSYIKKSMSQPFLAEAAGIGKKPSDIPEVFGILTTIEAPGDELVGNLASSVSRSKDSKRKSLLLSDFKEKFGKFLLRIFDIRTANKMSWAKVFHTRMCHGQDITPSEKVDHYIQLCTAFLLASAGEINKMTRFAKELMVHLAIHRMDLDGALMGHRPCLQLRAVVVRQFLINMKRFGIRDDAIQNYLQDQAEKLNALNAKAKGPASALALDPFRHRHASLPLDDLEDTSRENLLGLIMTWAKINDPNEMAKQVRTFAELFRGAEQVKEGDIVLVLIKKISLPWEAAKTDQQGRFSSMDVIHINSNTEFDIIYARATGQKNAIEQTMTVLITVDEDLTAEIPYAFIFPLPQSVIQLMQNAKTMEKLVSVPVDGFVDQLTRDIRTSSNTFLANQNVDINMVEKCAEGYINLMDLNILKKTTANLLRLVREPPFDFFQQLTDIAHSHILNFKEHFHSNMAFMPTKQTTMLSLETYNFGALAQEQINQYLCVCQDGLAKLKIEKRELLDGTRKSKLTQWWLHLIESRTDKFLQDLGFVVDALPDDYIEKPPKDMDVVKKNLEIIREVLDVKTDKHKTTELIKLLCDRIYPVIKDFVSQAQFMISEQFDLHKDPILDKYENELNSKLEKTEQIETWFAELMKDIKTLKKMKGMESARPDKKSLDIVPISGLIIGRFVRQENELKTAIELWNRPRKQSERPPGPDADPAALRKLASVPAAVNSARASAVKLIEKPESEPPKIEAPVSTSPEPPNPLIRSKSTPKVPPVASISKGLTSMSLSTIPSNTPSPGLALSPRGASSSAPPALSPAAPPADDIAGKIQKVKQDTIPRIDQLDSVVASFERDFKSCTSVTDFIGLAKYLNDSKQQLETLCALLPSAPILRSVPTNTQDKMVFLKDTISSLIEYYRNVLTTLRTNFDKQNNLKEVVLMVKAIRAVDIKPRVK
eukprot:TRINITY_DN172_c0_g1_i1.p1 TRINITY_DN172_c0_g1~~TRINITY_DN172_c0_g1_i1.p1  ORF type:complete len:941 (+),score=160.26 TRINITY_DN172_c0_g1_i1:162-2984(+)